MSRLLALLAAWLWLGLLDDAARQERAFHDAGGARSTPAEDGGA